MDRLKKLGERLERVLRAAVTTRQRAERMFIRSRQSARQPQRRRLKRLDTENA